MFQNQESRERDYRRRALEAAHARVEQVRRTKRDVPASRETPVAFLYLRVSTKEQARTGGGAEGYSIPAQREAGHTKAAALGAVVAEEYVDAGESAKSADRDDLQRMLRDVKTVKPDYVIVHKIDRLARNRADDIAINLLLKQHGVQLVSCTENIDDTPSGRLLYGLMAEIAQFYSGNLAQEVLKGMIRKAEEGGTPFRAPLGYRNRRETRDGVEHSWVELDESRAEIIRWCFEQYATGNWSGVDLTLAARDKGLTNRPTAKKPAQPISLSVLYHILSNPYYMGVVSYRNIHYEGKHPVLVEPDVWLAVQDILAAHATGEKDRVHPHYLRGTVFCSACGGRLVYSLNKGRSGKAYPYFFCVKKKTKANNCTRRAMRAEAVEAAVAEYYRRLQIHPAQAEALRAAVQDELTSQAAEARRDLERATKRKSQAQAERQKLLQAHYAGAIPQDLLAAEMNRLTRALAQAEEAVKAAKASNADIERTLELALAAVSNCHGSYLSASPSIRKQINQGFFVGLYIGENGSVERADLTEPFQPLLDPGQVIHAASPAESAVTVSTDHDRDDATERTYKTTDRHMQTVGGVKQNYVVGDTGIEPVTSSV